MNPETRSETTIISGFQVLSTIIRVKAETSSPGLIPNSSHLSVALIAARAGDSSDRRSPPPAQPSSSLQGEQGGGLAGCPVHTDKLSLIIYLTFKSAIINTMATLLFPVLDASVYMFIF